MSNLNPTVAQGTLKGLLQMLYEGGVELWGLLLMTKIRKND